MATLSPTPTTADLAYFEYRPTQRSPFMPDGQVSPLDSLVRSTRSRYRDRPSAPAFLSPLSISTTAPQTPDTSAPPSPLLHTNFGSPQKPNSSGPPSPASPGDLSESAYSPSPTSPSGYKPFSYLLDEFPSQTQQPCPVLPPPPPARRRKDKDKEKEKDADKERSLSPVLPGYQDSYFPPPERYRPRPDSFPDSVSEIQSQASSRGTWQSGTSNSDPDPFGFRAYEATLSAPRVVVDSPDSPRSPAFYVDGVAVVPEVEEEEVKEEEKLRGRVRSQVRYGSGNFSRPVIQVSRPSLEDDEPEEVRASPSPPPPPTRVLPPAPAPSQPQPRPFPHPLTLQPHAHTSPITPTRSTHLTSTPSTSTTASTTTTASTASPITPAFLPNPHEREERPRASSAASVYSEYSFYSLSGGASVKEPEPAPVQEERVVEGRYHKYHRASSPVATQPPTSAPRSPRPPPARKASDASATSSLSTLSLSSSSTRSTLLTPAQHLSLGIALHESDCLSRAADHFERAAKVGGGCALGMVMWGLTLRHGWGARRDEERGYRWLRRAAERAVRELEEEEEAGKGEEREREREGRRGELVLAVSEVAQCFMHGWGVPRDKVMGFNYFQVAARLGDVDAAQELGFCYANARGCARDMREAARWYRRAVAKGVSPVGLAWIWKSKYDD